MVGPLKNECQMFGDDEIHAAWQKSPSFISLIMVGPLENKCPTAIKYAHHTAQ